MKQGTKTLLIWVLLLGIVFFVAISRAQRRGQPPELTRIDAQHALQMLDADLVTGFAIRPDGIALASDEGEWLLVQPMDAEVLRALREHKIRPVAPPRTASSSSASSDLGWLWLPFLVLVGVVAFIVFLRKAGGQTNQIFELRKSKARLVEERQKATFDDIGGNREAVELLSDVVDFLQNPGRWTSSGARIPRGVLIVGPPGTGKTLLARAVAGETKAAFFYTSAAEFVEMFVGVGAARVRDTFEKASKQQPAVIFIDEIDAVGRRRGSGNGSMHEEREQTLNQLLVLLDGLERFDRLVVMAATNRPDILDTALLRSGRFDRMVRLSAPDESARAEILRIHFRNKRVDDGVSIDGLARKTDGFTGADLESLANEAALLAVRRTRTVTNANGQVVLTDADFDRALETMTRSGRRFDHLDSILVESVSQFAEPTGRAVARIGLSTGETVEGEIVWMNSSHIKLRLAEGTEVIVAKERAERIEAMPGTAAVPANDFAPDRWAGRSLEIG